MSSIIVKEGMSHVKSDIIVGNNRSRAEFGTYVF